MGNQKWKIRRHRQHSAHKKKEEEIQNTKAQLITENLEQHGPTKYRR